MPLRDSVFYPVIGIVVALMVLSSFYIGWQQPKCGPFGGANGPDDYSLIILKGQDLCRMPFLQNSPHYKNIFQSL